MQTAEGALGETTNIVQRIRELAVQSANGTLSAVNRTELQLEVTALIAQINAIAANTEFNSVHPIATGGTTIALQVGAEGGQTLSVVFTGADATTLVIDLADVGTVAGATTAIGLADATLAVLGTARAGLGAAQNRLEFTINTLAIEEENLSASESAIRDANIATETIAFTRNKILVAAGTSVLAQANLVPQTALQLLG